MDVMPIQNYGTENEYDTDSEEKVSNPDTFGLIFAVTQWQNLVVNAEDLFNRLVSNAQLAPDDRNLIEQWLCLKQECEECVGSDESISLKEGAIRVLDRIDEVTESAENTASVLSNEYTNVVQYGTSQTESDPDSDIDSPNPDFQEKLDELLETFKSKTDKLIKSQNPALANSSGGSETDSLCDEEEQQDESESEISDSVYVDPKRNARSLSKRRSSIHPGTEIRILQQNLTHETYTMPFDNENNLIICSDKTDIENNNEVSTETIKDDSLNIFSILNTCNSSSEPVELAEKLKILSAGKEARQSQMRQVLVDLEGAQKRIEELQHTIQIKEQFILDMIKNSDMRTSAKQRFQKKRNKLEEEYYRTRSQLAQAENALMFASKAEVGEENQKYKREVEKFKAVAYRYEKRLKDLEVIKQIAGDSAKKVLELENSLRTSKRQMDRLQKQLKKEEERKLLLEQELLEDQCKIKELEQRYHSHTTKTCNSLGENEEKRLQHIQEEESRLASLRESSLKFQEQLMQQQATLEKREAFLKQKLCSEKSNSKSILEVSARISNLEQMLKDRSIDIQKADVDDKELLRNEIRNLRKTRDCLLEQRCLLDEKFQKDKMLTTVEERKFIECDEAIEAIDVAIEYKNELMCGKKDQPLYNSDIQREKGEELLLARLMKLSPKEMRYLLYKYFQKVIDLRESGRRMEVQIAELDLQNETLKWKIQALSNALQQAHLETERRLVLMQKEHQEKLHLMLRHFADESSASSCVEHGNHSVMDRDSELNRFKQDNKHLKRRLREMEAILQATNRMHVASRSVSPVTIPQHNLKQLQGPTSPPTTKVTRQRNKLIIQQHKSRKHKS